MLRQMLEIRGMHYKSCNWTLLKLPKKNNNNLKKIKIKTKQKQQQRNIILSLSVKF